MWEWKRIGILAGGGKGLNTLRPGEFPILPRKVKCARQVKGASSILFEFKVADVDLIRARQVNELSSTLAQGCDSGEGQTSSHPPFVVAHRLLTLGTGVVMAGARMHLSSQLYIQHLESPTCQVRTVVSVCAGTWSGW